MSKGKEMKIAISGTIGSGNSTVSNYLWSKGFEVFDCDEANRELLIKGNKGYRALVSNFNNILDKKLEIDKTKLSSLVFNNKEALEKLNQIMHPLILEAMLESAKGQDIFIAEVPLLFETEFKNYFDYKLLIVCDEDIAIKRLAKRGFDEKSAKARINHQMPVGEKLKLADEAITNNDDEASLYLKIDEWIERMKLC